MENVIVKKAWGEEFALMSNDSMAIWHLSINAGERTSFHSHPNKRTSLIVLSGIAEVSFMNGKHRLISGDKINIRNGVFHRTQAICGDLKLIEVETPNNKLDLVRLEDDYGRSGQPYESLDNFQPNLFKPDFIKGERLGDCILKQFQVNSAEDLINREDAKIIILFGKITYNEHCIAGVGDTLDNISLSRLAKKFTCHPMTIMEVKNVYS